MHKYFFVIKILLFTIVLGMWLLFTVTILLAREVVGNLTTDEHDEEKKLANKNDLHNFSQLQTTDLKIPTQKLRETAKTNEKEGDFFWFFIWYLFIFFSTIYFLKFLIMEFYNNNLLILLYIFINYF